MTEPQPDDGRLDLDEALAELDRAPARLLEVEARHGFVFGGPGATGPGRPVAALVCTAPTCGHRGQHVQIHDDTVLPVHCGGCAAVLHCDHQPDTVTEGPTHADPLVHTITRCTACGTETARDSRDATDAELATLLPAGLRAALARLT